MTRFTLASLVGSICVACAPQANAEGVAFIVPGFHQYAIDGDLDGYFDHFEQWGLEGDQVLAGEPFSPFRDGRDDLVVFRTNPMWGPGFYVKTQDHHRGFSGRFAQFSSWGNPYQGMGGDLSTRAVIGDFDGDGRPQIAALHQIVTSWSNARCIRVDCNSDMAWVPYQGDRARNLYSAALSIRDKLLAGRIGAATDEMMIWRDATGNWELFTTQNGVPGASHFQTVQFGLPGDVPIVTDANGDGVDDLLVFRPSNRTLYINYYEPFAGQSGFGPNGDVDRTIDYSFPIYHTNLARGLPAYQPWNLGGTGIRW
ncbi:MAG: hypothetical protein AMXMBFR58_29170 [Phycisphaerae bacterium]